MNTENKRIESLSNDEKISWIFTFTKLLKFSKRRKPNAEVIFLSLLKCFLAILLLLPLSMVAQSISGEVRNDKKVPFFEAIVYWVGTNNGVVTGYNGEFEISMEGIEDKRLVATYVGYEPDTMLIKEESFIKYVLKESQLLDEVVVQADRVGIIISNLKTIKTEQITQTELKKSACCDLAGCFESQSSVQAQTTNVVTNAKELRILGLSGVYNQVLIDGLPMIQGLSHTYGISGLPGTLVENIYISKGANSVLQGFESISGQINVVTKAPNKTDKLLLNAYVNSFAEKHLNGNFAVKKGKWGNLTAMHTVQPANKIDRNDDNFLDLPLLTRYMISNKLTYGSGRDLGWNSKIGLRFLHEQRVGGQTHFNPDINKGSSTIYGQTVHLNQPEIWTKTGYRISNTQQLVFLSSAFQQNQESVFGTVTYNAKQRSFYSNLQYELSYLNNNNLKTGVSYRYLNLNENVGFTKNILDRTYAGDYEKLEKIPGLFAENTMRFFEDKLIWVAGIRGDHHNQFGWEITPRTLLKYDISPQTVVRASIGTGWKTVNLFSENINLLVSSRDIFFVETLDPEKAVNLGLNFTQKFDKDKLSGYFSADYYRTDFQNQIFPDYDTDPTKAIIKNFKDKSISNGFQAEAYVNVWKRFDFKLGYNFLDVYREIEGNKVLLPFNSKHKVLAVFGYKPLSKKFHFDVNMHWYGRQRLPNTQSNPLEFQRPDFSKPYTVVNAQLTYDFNRFEVYGGCENIFNFRQEQPIISWENPFGRYFDTSSVWGPVKGREIYLGLRFALEQE